MSNLLQPNINAPIHRLQRSGEGLDSIAGRIGIPEDRLKTIMGGDIPTLAEARNLVAAFGNTVDDYRPFHLQDDEWWVNQPPETQAFVMRLTERAAYGPMQAHDRLQTFEKRRTGVNLGMVAVTSIAVIGALLFGTWKGIQFGRLRREDRTWCVRTSGDRVLAYYMVGVEQAKKDIRFFKELGQFIEANPDVDSRIEQYRVLMDLTRYAMARKQTFQEGLDRTKALMGDQKTWKYRTTIKDPFTGQEIDLEAPDGGGIKMDELEKLVAIDTRSAQIREMAEKVAKGEMAPEKVQPLGQWVDTAKQDGAPAPSPWK